METVAIVVNTDSNKTRFEDVRGLTNEEYFDSNKFSIDAFERKYAINENETYVVALKRVCDYIASCEMTHELQQYWSKRWFDEIFNDWWQPAGSIMQGAANLKKISLMNCTTIALKNDTLEDIFRYAAYQVAKCAAHRQGLGIDFSNLRPRGAYINNSSNESSGAVHWMGFIDSIGYKVGQRGRIPAMLFSLHDNHPDIEEFITVKQKAKINNDGYMLKRFIEMLIEFGILQQVFPVLVAEKDIKPTTYLTVALAQTLRRNTINNEFKETLINARIYKDYVEIIALLIDIYKNGVDPKNIFDLYTSLISKSVRKDILEEWYRVMNIKDKYAKALLYYRPSVRGNDIIDDGFRGSEIGVEKNRRETEKFLELVDKLNESTILKFDEFKI